MRIQRTVSTDADAAAVFAYLSDFTSTTEWDPGTLHTTRLCGDGGPGTTYRNVSSFLGRRTELTYRVVEYRPDRLFGLVGENRSVTAHDSMRIDPVGTGAEVTYTADFSFKGVARLVAPFLGPALKRLGDGGERGLREALSRLPR